MYSNLLSRPSSVCVPGRTPCTVLSMYCTLNVLYSHLPTCPSSFCVPDCTPGTSISRYCTPTFKLIHHLYVFVAVLQILYFQGTVLPPAPSSILLLCSWLYSRYCTFKVLYSHLPTCPSFCCVPGCTPGTVHSRFCTPTCPLIHSFAVFLAVLQVLYFQGTLLQPAH